jgi:hypothetical protein
MPAIPQTERHAKFARGSFSSPRPSFPGCPGRDVDRRGILLILCQIIRPVTRDRFRIFPRRTPLFAVVTPRRTKPRRVCPRTRIIRQQTRQGCSRPRVVGRCKPPYTDSPTTSRSARRPATTSATRGSPSRTRPAGTPRHRRVTVCCGLAVTACLAEGRYAEGGYCFTFDFCDGVMGECLPFDCYWVYLCWHEEERKKQPLRFEP